jgi:hypothetical protein
MNINKKIVFLSAIIGIFLLLNINFASAYYENWNDYNADHNRNSYNSYGNNCYANNCNAKKGYQVNNYKDTTEYKQTTVTEVSDPWSSQKVTKTVNEKTTIETKNKAPVYYNDYNSGYNNFNGYNNYNSGNNYNTGYDSNNNYDSVPYSSFRYQQPYNSYSNYYYQPRYDSNSGYYNWRW